MTAELTEEELKYASEEDIAFFKKCIEGLPKSSDSNGLVISEHGETIPYSSGPHILSHFRESIEIVKPKAILEIGFNVGYGASMFLNLCDAYVLSIDITKRPETIDAFGYLYNKYKGRFDFGYRWLEGSTGLKLNRRQYDLCFIDGAHDEDSVTNDIRFCMILRIPYILFDDWYPRYGETQKAVAKFPELELVKDMNNLRLYKVNYG